MPSVNPASPPPTIVMGLAGGMFQSFRRAMNKWLNRPTGRSTSSQFFLSGQSAESSLPANPARMLMRPSWQVTGPQPITHSRRPQSRGSHERRGSSAMTTRDELRRQPEQFGERLRFEIGGKTNC